MYIYTKIIFYVSYGKYKHIECMFEKTCKNRRVDKAQMKII